MSALATSDAALDRLAAALAEERRALLDHDIELLVRSTQEKLAALRELETDLPDGLAERLVELAENNRSNGALLARRRREVNWALRHLGRAESAPEYDAQGQSQQLQARRDLAVV
ncbi:flagellar protein FlgN [Pseudoxanthomonas broegbernensis]|uniref:Flagellar protein FlgN n=1 Tax=Pseudoxanthomonas broegbernensis TaxID=83619 RepID=A0A7V8GL62_9GAMM|nr:flagellar protein FlgN [Pseudoxanthomonas broegbernensis]KAF1685575.1 flagellar protein FlgN [Pseudoxanthomonas broegbernensis]MBB6065946.1 flagellar biosynthesis/type III secretory pathway chaperone [Pseudoxanthomonas broegbernensis]